MTLTAPPSLHLNPLRAPATTDVAPLIELENVAWDTYEAILRDTAEQHVRITYDEGRMVLMSPLPRHDKVKSLLGRIIETISVERDVPISSFGSTTWRRPDLRKGLEPDECYYVQREPHVRCRFDIDLSVDPAPDLAIEIEITHHPMNRGKIYAALGIPEVWRFDGTTVSFLRLDDAFAYTAIDRSEAFPFLTVADVNRLLGLFDTLSEHEGIKQVAQWARALTK